MTPTTCQICGRPIKANTGTIAHHGYQRPGQGWQTASCFGAKYRPYEIACDAIPPAIASAQAYLARCEKYLIELTTTPPAKLDYLKNRGAWNAAELVTVDRPDNFDPARQNYIPGSYATVYSTKLMKLRNEIKSMVMTVESLKARLANWKEAA